MKPAEIIAETGLKQAYKLAQYVAERYEIYLSAGEAWALLDDLPKNTFAFEVALNSCLNERGYFHQDGQNARDYEKLDPLRITVKLHMGWTGGPFADAAPVKPQVARSKLFNSMEPIQPIDAVAALVGGQA